MAKSAIVLLPGLDGTGLLFRRFAQWLPGDCEVRTVAYPADVHLTLSDYAREVTQAWPKGRVVLVAESFSGLVALTLLTETPVRPDAIVFCATFAEPPRPWLLRVVGAVPQAAGLAYWLPDFLLRFCCVGRAANASLADAVRAALRQVPVDVLVHRLRLVGARHSFFAEPSTIPCVYLQASGDRLVPAGAAAWFAKHFASFRLERIAGPHFLLQAEPQRCADVVNGLLREVVR